MSEKLLLCPFCGGEAVDTHHGRWCLVVCTQCHASSDEKYSEQEAIDAWNRRVGGAPVVHGEWEKESTCGKNDKMRCTACTCLLLVNWFDRSMVYRFCPNCGARMDGGSDG